MHFYFACRKIRKLNKEVEKLKIKWIRDEFFEFFVLPSFTEDQSTKLFHTENSMHKLLIIERLKAVCYVTDGIKIDMPCRISCAQPRSWNDGHASSQCNLIRSIKWSSMTGSGSTLHGISRYCFIFMPSFLSSDVADRGRYKRPFPCLSRKRSRPLSLHSDITLHTLFNIFHCRGDSPSETLNVSHFAHQFFVWIQIAARFTHRIMKYNCADYIVSRYETWNRFYSCHNTWRGVEIHAENRRGEM